MDSSDRWRFSTVRAGSGFTALNDRDNAGAHPVSGNREFGINEDHSGWVIYTRGADRTTRAMDQALGVPVLRDWGFEKADTLWKSFQTKVAAFVNNHGGAAEVDAQRTTSKRHDWDQIRRSKEVYDTEGQPAWVPVPQP